MSSERVSLDYDSWLAGIFGRDVYRVSIRDHGLAGEALPAAAVDQKLRDAQSGEVFMYAKLGTSAVSTVAYLESLGFGLVDTRIIEKHFTIDKHHSDFRDHQLSADPRELAQLVQRVKEADVPRGNGEKVIQRCEQDNLPAARRSIAAGRDLPKGVTITRDDIAWTRPGGGLAPGSERRVLGRILNRLVPVGEMITPELLSETARP